MVTASAMVDWDFAATTACSLMTAGPAATPGEVRAVVDSLREAAVRAEQPIAETARMEPIAPMAPVLVVDRHTWARANISAFDAALSPLVDLLTHRSDDHDEVANSATGSSEAASGRSAAVVGAVGSRATAFQVGTLLAYVGTKVLGQHEVFTQEGTEPRLMLVAPNVLLAERSLGVDPDAFRLWVCLHEQTHSVQLASAPWLRDMLRDDLRAFFEAADLDTTSLRERLGELVSSSGAAVRGESGRSLLEAVQTPEQREILDRLVALMTLLEGHADWAMDEVGDEVVPGVAQVRAAFERRRGGVGRLDQLLRRLFGLDQKLAQYREGAAFVRGVISAVGVDGLNAVWSGPQTLPLRSEIDEPLRWVERVHGQGVVA